MKFTQITSVLALASAAAASPAWYDWNRWGNQNQNQKCITQDYADSVISKFVSVLAHTNIATANATAQALFSDSYTEVSDSILSLEGQPLGGATFVGKQNYINGVLNSPGVQGIETISTMVANCNHVMWYWRFTGIGSKQYAIKGFNLFNFTSDYSQVQSINVEFNSIAWGLDTGYQLIFPSTVSPTG